VADPQSGRVLEVWSTNRDCNSTAAIFWTTPSRARAVRSIPIAAPSPWNRSIIRITDHPNFPSVVLKPGEVYHNTSPLQILTE